MTDAAARYQSLDGQAKVVQNLVYNPSSGNWELEQQGMIEAVTSNLYAVLDEVESKLDSSIAYLATIDADTGAIKTASESIVDTGNSTSDTLAGDATWTGTSKDVSGYIHATVSVFADQASATDGLVVEYSSDNSNWDIQHAHTISASTPHILSIPISAQYLRIKLTNGNTGQGSFRLQTLLQTAAPSGHVERLDGDIADDTEAQVVRSVLAAQKPDSTYTNIACTSGGNLKISLEEASDGMDIGAGNAGTETLRVSISTDDVNLAAIKTAVEIMDDVGADALSAYHFYGWELDTSVFYMGYQTKAGAWYAKKYDPSAGTMTYAAGASSPPAVADLSAQSYAAFETTF